MIEVFFVLCIIVFIGQLELSSYPPTNASYCLGNVTYMYRSRCQHRLELVYKWHEYGELCLQGSPDEIFPHVIFSNQTFQITVTNTSLASSISHNVVSTLQGDVSFLFNKSVYCEVLNAQSVSYFI